jgi:hypothetical protein
MSGLMIFLIVVLRGDAVGVSGKIVEFGGSLVPVVPALPAAVGCFAHVSLLKEIPVKCSMAIVSILHSVLCSRPPCRLIGSNEVKRCWTAQQHLVARSSQFPARNLNPTYQNDELDANLH